jgi:hypothetical protein
VPDTWKLHSLKHVYQRHSFVEQAQFYPTLSFLKQITKNVVHRCQFTVIQCYTKLQPQPGFFAFLLIPLKIILKYIFGCLLLLLWFLSQSWSGPLKTELLWTSLPGSLVLWLQGKFRQCGAEHKFRERRKGESGPWLPSCSACVQVLCLFPPLLFQDWKPRNRWQHAKIRLREGAGEKGAVYLCKWSLSCTLLKSSHFQCVICFLLGSWLIEYIMEIYLKSEVLPIRKK